LTATLCIDKVSNMTHHLVHSPSRTSAHLALGIIVLAAVLTLVHWPRLAPAIGSTAIVIVAVHVVLVSAILFAVRRRARGDSAVGNTLHSARLYDAFVGLYTLGREDRLRARMLDAASLARGERVLDVCCGTGTLTLAARNRVGPSGSVHGVDASPEMIARATDKADGADVAFQVAPAQSLPFPDGSFDVVLCSLGFHHLPEAARDAALAEMHRVLAPGGRAVIVEFLRNRSLLTLSSPVEWAHLIRSRDVFDAAVAGLARAGFDDVTTDALGFRRMGYARAIRRA
jgi:ubiquinone/menaquinone biosynthesis C-methylase UbiE